jgi:hypothetical protein
VQYLNSYAPHCVKEGFSRETMAGFP